jgi:hypothetical protein
MHEYIGIGCLGAFRNKNKQVAKFLIENDNPNNSYLLTLPANIPTYGESIRQYRAKLINSDELSEKLIANYDEIYDLTHGAIYIP